MIFATIVLMVSVFLFAFLLARIVSQAVSGLQERYGVKDHSDIGDLVLVLDRRSTWIGSGSLGVLVGVFTYLLGGWGGALASFAAVLFGLPFLVARSRRRWTTTLEAQLADGLGTVAGALRAGLSLPRALEQLAEETPKPLGKELAMVVRESKLGVSIDEALGGLGRRVVSEDVDLVVVSIAVARQLGGNLSELLEAIAATTRERIKISGKIQALTAQGKMQAWIIAGLPLALGLAMAWIRPDLIEPMLAHPFGWALIAVVATMEIIGLLLIRKIVAIRI